MPTPTYLDDEEEVDDPEDTGPIPTRPKPRVLPSDLADDEDEEPAGAGGGAAPVASAHGAPSSDPVYARLQELAGDRPVRPKPKWFQTLAAAGFGGLAGWSNAAGRSRSPIDIDASTDNILAPGYKEKVKEYESKVAPVEAQANVIGQRAKANQAEATTEYRRAGAQAARDRGAYFRHRAETDQKQWVQQKDGSLLNTVTGETRHQAATPEELFKQAKALGASDDQARGYSLTRKWTAAPSNRPVNVSAGGMAVDPQTGRVIATNPKGPKEVDPEIAENRRASRELRESADLDRVAQSKETNEQQLHASRQRELTQAMVRLGAQSEQQLPPEMLADVNRRYAKQLQVVQDNFANSLRRRGRPAEDWDVDPDTLEYRRRGEGAPGAAAPVVAPTVRQPAPGRQTPPAPQAGAQVRQYTEQEVRAYSRAKGLTPAQVENAVAIARQRGSLR